MSVKLGPGNTEEKTVLPDLAGVVGDVLYLHVQEGSGPVRVCNGLSVFVIEMIIQLADQFRNFHMAFSCPCCTQRSVMIDD